MVHIWVMTLCSSAAMTSNLCYTYGLKVPVRLATSSLGLLQGVVVVIVVVRSRSSFSSFCCKNTSLNITYLGWTACVFGEIKIDLRIRKREIREKRGGRRKRKKEIKKVRKREERKTSNVQAGGLIQLREKGKRLLETHAAGRAQDHDKILEAPQRSRSRWLHLKWKCMWR